VHVTARAISFAEKHYPTTGEAPVSGTGAGTTCQVCTIFKAVAIADSVAIGQVCATEKGVVILAFVGSDTGAIYQVCATGDAYVCAGAGAIC
jgi:hypothetical protein